MADPATTVAEYLAALPEDRRTAIAAIRDTINANLPAGYEEGIQYGMPSWYIPLERYPTTYNKQPLAIASLGSQKNYMALYLMTVYGNSEIETWFRQAFADAGKKLNMGKSCVRFKKLDELPLDVIGQTIAKVSVDDYIAFYEKARGIAPDATSTNQPTEKSTKTAKQAEQPAKQKTKQPANKQTKRPANKQAKQPAKKAKQPAKKAKQPAKKQRAKK